jgi:hypothetical protein
VLLPCVLTGEWRTQQCSRALLASRAVCHSCSTSSAGVRVGKPAGSGCIAALDCCSWQCSGCCDIVASGVGPVQCQSEQLSTHSACMAEPLVRPGGRHTAGVHDRPMALIA